MVIVEIIMALKWYRTKFSNMEAHTWAPPNYRMELSLMNEIFSTHEAVNDSIESAIKFVGSLWELTILGIQKITKSSKISCSISVCCYF